MKRMAALGLVLILTVGALAGCGGPGGASGENEIKVGLIAPLSGDAKTFGESVKNAFELALEQADFKAGDYKITPVIRDDLNDPNQGPNRFDELVQREGIKALVGPTTTDVTIPVSKMANDSKIVMITGTATSPNVTVNEDGTRKEFVFRSCYTDPFMGSAAAKFAREDLDKKRAAVIYNKASDYSTGLAKAFEKTFKASGGEVVASEVYITTDVDFSAVLTKIAGKNPDVLYLPDYYMKVSLIGAQAREKGLDVVMLGSDGWDSSELDYKSMDGGYFVNHYSPDDPRPEVQTFVKDYEEKYGAKPDALASLAYDATNLLLKAIETANSDDPEKIREAMQNLKDVEAVGGRLSFDEYGNPVKPALILQVDGVNKTHKLVKTIEP